MLTKYIITKSREKVKLTIKDNSDIHAIYNNNITECFTYNFVEVDWSNKQKSYYNLEQPRTYESRKRL